MFMTERNSSLQCSGSCLGEEGEGQERGRGGEGQERTGREEEILKQ